MYLYYLQSSSGNWAEGGAAEIQQAGVNAWTLREVSAQQSTETVILKPQFGLR